MKQITQEEYSFEQIKNKYLLGQSYNSSAYDCYIKLHNARHNYDFNSIDIYEGKLYVIIINALKSNCIGFEYEVYWQTLMQFLLQNDFGICQLTTVTGTDINYLMRIIHNYCKMKLSKGYLADLKTNEIYNQIYQAYNPADFNIGNSVVKSKCPYYPHIFYM